MRAGARWQQGLPPDEKIKRRLIRAAYAGDEASVETLLAAHPHVQSDHFECLADALCEPWNQGGTGTSRISESVNVETPPPIIAALIAKRSGCVRLLLEYGAAAYRPPPPTGSGAIGASVLKSAQRSDDEASLILILQALADVPRAIDRPRHLGAQVAAEEGDKTKSGATFVELSSLSPSDDDETEAPPPAGALRRKWFSHGRPAARQGGEPPREESRLGRHDRAGGQVDMLDESLGLETYFVEQLDFTKALTAEDEIFPERLVVAALVNPTKHPDPPGVLSNEDSLATVEMTLPTLYEIMHNNPWLRPKPPSPRHRSIPIDDAAAADAGADAGGSAAAAATTTTRRRMRTARRLTAPRASLRRRRLRARRARVARCRWSSSLTIRRGSCRLCTTASPTTNSKLLRLARGHPHPRSHRRRGGRRGRRSGARRRRWRPHVGGRAVAPASVGDGAR